MSKTKEKEEKKLEPSQDFTKKFLEANKDFHYNLQESAEEYLVSSGTMNLDSELGGGFSSGVHRFCGANGGGKTSEALEVMKNMLRDVKGSKGVYIKAEGRLSKKMMLRSGIKFVTDVKDWVEGTCWIFECNVFDTVFDYLRGLLKNNPQKFKFCFILDSMDGLIPKCDLEKSTSDAPKVAAGALLTSDFLKRVSLGMSKFGHMCILISQVRSVIKGQYEKMDPNNQTGSSGGNASLHYPDWILEFRRSFKKDKILKFPDQPITPENTIYGHIAKVLICKSNEENEGMEVRYPIKHGKTGGSSVWIERELIELLVMWGFIIKKGSWFKMDEELSQFVDDKKIGIPKNVQGMANIYDYLDKDSEATKALSEFVSDKILSDGL